MPAPVQVSTSEFHLPFRGQVNPTYVATTQTPWYEALRGKQVPTPNQRIARKLGLMSVVQQRKGIVSPCEQTEVIDHADAIANMLKAGQSNNLINEKTLQSWQAATMGSKEQLDLTEALLGQMMSALEQQVLASQEQAIDGLLRHDISLSDGYSEWLNNTLQPLLNFEVEGFGSCDGYQLRVVHEAPLAVIPIAIDPLPAPLKQIVWELIDSLTYYNCMSSDMDHLEYFAHCEGYDDVCEQLNHAGCESILNLDDDDTEGLLSLLREQLGTASVENRLQMESPEDLCYELRCEAERWLKRNQPWFTTAHRQNNTDPIQHLQAVRDTLNDHQRQQVPWWDRRADEVLRVLNAALQLLSHASAHYALTTGASDIWLGDGRAISLTDDEDVLNYLNETIQNSGEWPAAALNLNHPEWRLAIHHFIVADLLLCYLSEALAPTPN